MRQARSVNGYCVSVKFVGYCLHNSIPITISKQLSMHIYILKRLLALIPTLFGITVLVFFMVHLVPGDPAQIMLG